MERLQIDEQLRQMGGGGGVTGPRNPKDKAYVLDNGMGLGMGRGAGGGGKAYAGMGGRGGRGRRGGAAFASGAYSVKSNNHILFLSNSCANNKFLHPGCFSYVV